MSDEQLWEKLARRVASDESLALSGGDSEEARAARRRLVEFSEMAGETKAGVLATLAALRNSGRV
jgi:hypothetical protein